MLVAQTYRLWDDPNVVAHFQSMDIPFHTQSVEIFLRLLPFERNQPIRVLDLGCGGGSLLSTLLNIFPNASGIGLDFSEPMLALARANLAVFGNRAGVVPADFNNPEWTRPLDGSFDAIVSRYAIHHVPDDRKRGVYRESYATLNPDGIFVNIEHVASLTPRGEALYDRLAVDTLYAGAMRRGEEPTYADVEAAFHRRPDKAANILTRTDVQLEWLRAAGFKDVDCYWKCFELAILAGYKNS